jgi:tripartite-type tricarboxylate transporter receptor subunit TctC
MKRTGRFMNARRSGRDSGILLRGAIAFVIATLVSTGSALGAEPYPSKPIRIVVPFTPGGPNDLMGRIVAQGLTERLKQNAVVDNRPGAGTVIGTEIVAKAAPDGYVLLLASITHSINPGLLTKLPYDSINGFVPIAILAKAAGILVAHPSLGVQSLKELVAAARAKPNAIAYASSGTGSGGHMEMELLKSYAKIDLQHIPYKGGAAGLNDVLSGRVQLMLTSPVNVLPHIKTGKLRALGITSGIRSPVAPEIPTLNEAGLPGYDSTVWYALLAPAGTPHGVVRVLNAESRAIMSSESTTRRLSDQSITPTATSPEEAAAFIKSEIARWTKLVREANIRPD